MQYSMTGYGRDERTSDHIQITTEIKTLNSKFLDLSLKIPVELNPKENEIRLLITNNLKRGKVLATIELAPMEVALFDSLVDEQLFTAYFDTFQRLAKDRSVSSDLFKLSIMAPEVLKKQAISLDKISWKAIEQSLQIAIGQCQEFRVEEGKALEQKLSEYIQTIAGGLDRINDLDTQRNTYIKARLQRSIDEIREKVKIDENRFEQELIYYLEKMDISEEKVRLHQHLSYFDEVLKEEQSGKKLGFISQEIGREINTIGSKANDAEIQKVVIEMKDELEKIKEQVLNII